MKKKTFVKVILYVLLIGCIFNMDFSKFLGYFLIGLVTLLFIYPKKSRKKNQNIVPITKEKKDDYLKLGMTEQEIIFFRETMNQTKNQIIQLQKNMSTSTKLKTINLRNDTLKIVKSLFKELVKEPTKIHSANHFLYTHLPNLVDLTTKYIEIDSHEVKNKQTYEKLEESALIIDQVSKLIKKDYEQFLSEKIENLDLEISVAKKSIKEDNKFE